MQVLQEKTDKAIKLYENLVNSVNSVYIETKKEETNEIPLPSFIL